MIHLSVQRIRPDKLERLKAWFAEVETRGDEVRETFAQEGVTCEQAYLLSTSDGPVLIYVEECDDFEAAVRVFQNSTLAIDAEHKAVLADVIEGDLTPQLLFNMHT